MWKRAMQALNVGIQAAACPGTIVPVQARLDLVSAISQMQVRSLQWCRTLESWLAMMHLPWKFWAIAG